MFPTNSKIVERCYSDHHKSACRYVASKINDDAAAEDIVQDAYVRLLEYDYMLMPNTVKSFFFTAVRNIMWDYLYRRYKRHEIDDYLMETTPTSSEDTVKQIEANDLRQWENFFSDRMPAQRRLIYCMSRYDEMSVSEISERLDLSIRTVENHLRLGRHYVREEIRKII